MLCKFTKFSYFLDHIYFVDKIKLILCPQVRNPKTHLTLLSSSYSGLPNFLLISCWVDYQPIVFCLGKHIHYGDTIFSAI